MRRTGIKIMPGRGAITTTQQNDTILGFIAKGKAEGARLVAGGTALLLCALRAQQVTEARRATHELAAGREFEPLGDGLLGLLHGMKGQKQRRAASKARGNFDDG